MQAFIVRSSLLAGLALALVFAGCTERADPPVGGDADRVDSGPGGSDVLRIEPLDHVQAITGGVPAVVDYRAFLNEGGSEREVTSEVTWASTVPALGSFAGPRFTSSIDVGGVTSVRATLGAEIVTTSLTLTLERSIIGPGAPADAPTRFGGTVDPSLAPELVYPDDETMVPPNLGELEFHYRGGTAELFELAFMTPAVSLRVYFGCPESAGGGCIYTPDRDVWTAIATAARGNGPTTYTLRSVDSAGRVGEAAARTLIVAEEDITGGLYYWNAGGGTIDRFEFGVPGARAEQFLDQRRVGASTCVGCHALSRDGTRISVGTDIPTTSFQVFDVATRTRIFSLGGGGIGGFPNQPNFASWSPDSAQIVVSGLSGLRILDGATGTEVAGGLGGGASSMPDWSPDGEHIVYVRHMAPGGFGLSDVPGVSGGIIARLDRSGSSWTMGPTLVGTGTDNNYYPAYSPDGRWIVFNRSPSNSGSMGDGGGSMGGVRDAELWVVAADGGSPAFRLDNVMGLADSWPKWDPTEYRDRDRPLYWLAWSSLRPFGLRYGADTRVQLWMAAFDPSAPGMSRTPTYRAFRLPFQDIATGNHIAQWVTRVERMTCTTDADCGGEFCVDGRCYEEPPLI